MRLIRRKNYRAIPELDRFTDEQCERFVGSATSSWARRIGRWMVVGAATLMILCGSLFGVIQLAEFLDSKMVFWGTIGFIGWGVLLVAGTGAGLDGGLVVRDWTLRRRVRQLIARCGACPSCHYSLMGMRVGKDLTIVCPECGRSLAVDPAMEELATDEIGAPVYRPTVARDDAATVARRRKRHRKFLKWTAISAVSFVLMLGAAYGVWWWWLVEQAKTAAAERRTREIVTGLRQAMWKRGPETNSETEFCRFVELLQRVRESQFKRNAMPEYASPDGKFQGFNWESVKPDFDAVLFEKRSGPGTFEPTRRYVLDVLKECREDGTFDQLREILSMRAPIRELDTDWKSPFFGVLLPDLGMARGLGRVNAARMVQSLHAGHRQDYVDALEESLATAQIIERQGLLIEELVGYAIRSHIYARIVEQHEQYPDDAWTRDVLEAVLRRAEIVPMWRSMQVERAGAMDAVQCFFSRPDQVRRAQCGLGTPDFFGGSATGGGFAGGWCGGYQGNKRAIDSYFDPWIAFMQREPWHRKTPPFVAPSGYAVVDQILPALTRAANSEAVVLRDRNFCVATLAVDRHRHATGQYPTSVHQLRPYVGMPELLIDTGSGLPYRFGFVQEEGQRELEFQIMLGDDERPAKPEPLAPKPSATPLRPVQSKKK